ncbi:ACOX2 isoform 13, partial [Pan troglodytes]
EALEKLENEPAIQQVLKRLCDLHAIHGILTNSGDFLHDAFLSGAQVDMARTAYLDLLCLIREIRCKAIQAKEMGKVDSVNLRIKEMEGCHPVN